MLYADEVKNLSACCMAILNELSYKFGSSSVIYVYLRIDLINRVKLLDCFVSYFKRTAAEDRISFYVGENLFGIFKSECKIAASEYNDFLCKRQLSCLVVEPSPPFLFSVTSSSAVVK